VNDRERTGLKEMTTGEQIELATGAVIAEILRGHRLL
jgi:hypothetical protein